MSFILEALKKADAERDRGAVPDLHAQAMLPEAAFEGDGAGRARPWLWLLAGIVVALIAGLVWQWLGSDAPTVETAAAPAPNAVAPAPVPGLTAASMPSPAASVPANSGAGTAQRRSSAAPTAAPETTTATPAAARGPTAKPDSPAQPARRTRDVEPRRPGAEPDVESGQAAAAKTGVRSTPALPGERAAKDAARNTGNGAGRDAAEDAKARAARGPERVPLFTELPDEVRRQVPALKLGGLVYSAAPASRMVLVNGDVQREGSTVAPGLTLERINPKSAVFSLRGQRFEVPL